MVVFMITFACTLASNVEAQRIATSGDAVPPKARIEAKVFHEHGGTRVDNYFWLRDRESQEVLDYVEAENRYLERMLAHIKPLQNALFEEIKGRIKQDEASVPYRQGNHYYYTRYEEGQEYAIYARKNGTLDAGEELLVDANDLAAGHSFFAIRNLEPSVDGRIIAYAEDTTGRRIYTIRFKDLESGHFLDDLIPEVTGNFVWANDNRTLFYSKQDPKTLRSDRIYRHIVGTPVSEDLLVYDETDDTFHVGVGKTRSGRYIVITSTQTVSTEVRFLDAETPEGEFTIVQPRERGLEYSVDHQGDHFLIRTNFNARNFRLMRAKVSDPGKGSWEEVIQHRPDVLLEDIDAFQDFLVVTERTDGLIRLQVRPVDGSEPHYIDFGEPAYMAFVGTNMVFDTETLRYGYTSMTTPYSVFDYGMVSHETKLMKESPVLGGFDKQDYETRRIYAAARDGMGIPISLVYRKGFEPSSSTPLLLYGYGSYGYSMDAAFASSRLSLLDRGFTFAIAHIRGGQEMGRAWYEDGKLLNKKNTFYDFIDCADFLIQNEYADSGRVFAMGGSAGGLLMGAVMNLRPGLFKGVVAQVPFVDVVTTMLDETIPLTTGEYDEWGNPNDKLYYDYMLSYSPYDQVLAANYPNLLVTSGLHDSQVQFWEPTKWVAKLRKLKTGNSLLLLHTNMDAGHGGQSGRFRQYQETALEYGFLLDLAGYSKGE